MLRADEEGIEMEQHGPRISRSALARMTGATALGLAVAPEVAGARSSGHTPRHLHRSHVLVDGRAGDVGMDAEALEDAFARVAQARNRRPLPRRRRARGAPRHRRRRARVRRPPRGLERGDDDRHALRPRIDDEGAGDGDCRDDPGRPRQALADRAGRQVPAALRRERQGRRARARPAALLLGAADRQPEGRHRRHRRDLALHGGDAARVPDGLDGRVLGSRLSPARPRDRGGRGHEPRRVREARDLGPARHGATRPSTRAPRSPPAAPRPALARCCCGPARCAAPCRTTRTGRSAASPAATARSPPRATSRSSAR